jgi:hypothetical protein
MIIIIITLLWLLLISIVTITIIIFLFRNSNVLFAIIATYHLRLFVFLHFCIPVIYPWLYVVSVHYVVTYNCAVLYLSFSKNSISNSILSTFPAMLLKIVIFAASGILLSVFRMIHISVSVRTP